MTKASPIRSAFAQAEEITPGDAGGPGDGTPDPDAPAPEAEAALFPLNDFGNGRRLAHYFGQDLNFVPRLGWHRWDGRRWAVDEDTIATRRDAQGVAARIVAEMDHLELSEDHRQALESWDSVRAEFRELQRKARGKDPLSEEDAARMLVLQDFETAASIARKARARLRADHQSHAKASGNSPKITNMMVEAQGALAVDLGQLNADPLQFCVENGVLHFDRVPDPHEAAWGDATPRVPRVRLLPHARGQKITKIAAAPYDADAKCDRFLAFLARIQPDPDIRDFLQRWIGYTITGLTTEQKLAFFYGHGRNGKSTLVDLVARILGDYASTIPIETLTGAETRKGSDATPDLVRLPGARFVRASEPEQGQKMKEALIKSLTGGEPILIRRMHSEFVEIEPEFKLTISGNYKPEVRGADDGIWRRIMLVPFGEQIPVGEVDANLPGILWAERAGILRWMVEGCLAWMQGGLRPPETVAQATEAYRRESDPLRTFLESECKITGLPEDRELARDMGDAFNAWLLSQGTSAWGKRQVANQLRRRSESVTGPGGEVFAWAKVSDAIYRGIVLTDAARDRLAAYGDQLRGTK